MTPNPTTPAPTTEEWMITTGKEIARRFYCYYKGNSAGTHDAAVYYDGVGHTLPGPASMIDYCIGEVARHYAAAHPTWTEDTTEYRIKLQSIIERLSDERDQLTTALAEAKARCGELEKEKRDIAYELSEYKGMVKSVSASRQFQKDRAYVAESTIATQQATIARLTAATEGVIRVADRKTIEFDEAKAAIAQARRANLTQSTASVKESHEQR